MNELEIRRNAERELEKRKGKRQADGLRKEERKETRQVRQPDAGGR